MRCLCRHQSWTACSHLCLCWVMKIVTDLNFMWNPGKSVLYLSVSILRFSSVSTYCFTQWVGWHGSNTALAFRGCSGWILFRIPPVLIKVSVVPSVSAGRYQERTSVRPQLLPSRSSNVHHSSYHLTTLYMCPDGDHIIKQTTEETQHAVWLLDTMSNSRQRGASLGCRHLRRPWDGRSMVQNIRGCCIIFCFPKNNDDLLYSEDGSSIVFQNVHTWLKLVGVISDETIILMEMELI